MLKDDVRQALIDQAQTGELTTYKEVADRLGLEPPQTIRRVGDAIETLIEEDVVAGRPLIAALCVSRTLTGIPSRGFFLKAEMLGLFSGDPAGPEAHAFHADALQRALAYYGGTHPTPGGSSCGSGGTS